MNGISGIIPKTLIVLMTALTVTGCANLGPPYDPQTENTVMKINEKTHGMLIDLEKSHHLPEADYKKHQPTYKAIRLDLSSLALRASAIPKNSETQKQIVLLSKTVDQLEELHQAGFGKTIYGRQEAIKSSKLTLKQALGAMLRLEFAKKRGIDTTTTTQAEG